MRQTPFKENEYYHVQNSGAAGAKIFLDDEDFARFLFLIIHLQSPTRIYNISWYSKDFLQRGGFRTKDHTINEVARNRSVEMLCFTIMPDRFDLIIKNIDEQVLSVYMQRVLTAYSKYFNAKYKKRGHVFNGPFEAARIKNTDAVIKLSHLIHRFPQKLPKWGESFDRYPWSSCQDYTDSNRWGSLLATGLVLKHFKDQSKYLAFVKTDKVA